MNRFSGLSAILTLFMVTGTTAGAQIVSESVPSGSIKTYEYKGESATVSHKVPGRFFGTYRYSPSGGEGRGSQTMAINSDGSGYFQFNGSDQPKMDFSWGFLVQENKLVVTTYTSYAAGELGSWSAHPIVMKFSSGTYGSTFVFIHEGKLTLRGNQGRKMVR
jgi:hypothetical protein